MNIGFSTAGFPKEKNKDDLIQWCHMLFAAGYVSTELSCKHHDLGARSEFILETGIKVSSIHGIATASVALDESDRKAAVNDEIRRMYDCAAFAPCPYVIHYLNRHNNPEIEKQFRKSIDELLVVACELGFCLAMETAPYKPEVNERYPNSEEIASFVRSYDDPHLKMTIDVNHSNLNESLKDVCRNCKNLIVNVHVSDNHGLREEHLVPGRGVIDFPSAFADLRMNGYEGPWNIELHEEGNLTQEKLSLIYKKVAMYATQGSVAVN